MIGKICDLMVALGTLVIIGFLAIIVLAIFGVWASVVMALAMAIALGLMLGPLWLCGVTGCLWWLLLYFPLIGCAVILDDLRR